MQRTRIVVLACTLLAGISACADPGTPKVATVPPAAHAAGPARTDPAVAPVLPTEADVADTVAYVEAVQVDEFTAWAATWPSPEPPPTTTTVPDIGAPAPRSAAGVRVSQGWLEQLARCESGWPSSGTENTWRTGYFGLEAGYPIGHLSWGEQAAWVQRIIDGGGWPSAWGCSSSVPWPY
jgi:hypothetical protein